MTDIVFDICLEYTLVCYELFALSQSSWPTVIEEGNYRALFIDLQNIVTFSGLFYQTASFCFLSKYEMCQYTMPYRSIHLQILSSSIVLQRRKICGYMYLQPQLCLYMCYILYVSILQRCIGYLFFKSGSESKPRRVHYCDSSFLAYWCCDLNDIFWHYFQHLWQCKGLCG